MPMTAKKGHYTADLVTFTEEALNGTSFFCVVLGEDGVLVAYSELYRISRRKFLRNNFQQLRIFAKSSILVVQLGSK